MLFEGGDFVAAIRALISYTFSDSCSDVLSREQTDRGNSERQYCWLIDRNHCITTWHNLGRAIFRSLGAGLLILFSVFINKMSSRSHSCCLDLAIILVFPEPFRDGFELLTARPAVWPNPSWNEFIATVIIYLRRSTQYFTEPVLEKLLRANPLWLSPNGHKMPVDIQAVALPGSGTSQPGPGSPTFSKSVWHFGRP
jgi:hypothetical protein